MLYERQVAVTRLSFYGRPGGLDAGAVFCGSGGASPGVGSLILSGAVVGCPPGRTASFAGKAPALAPFDRLRAGRQARSPPRGPYREGRAPPPHAPTDPRAERGRRGWAAGRDGPLGLSPRTVRPVLDCCPNFATHSKALLSTRCGTGHPPRGWPRLPSRPILRYRAEH